MDNSFSLPALKVLYNNYADYCDINHINLNRRFNIREIRKAFEMHNCDQIKALTYLIDKTRQFDRDFRKLISFDSYCPDCGNMIKQPEFHRETILYNSGKIAKQPVYAQCPICGWRTSVYDNIRDCANEWNSANLYEIEVMDE